MHEGKLTFPSPQPANIPQAATPASKPQQEVAEVVVSPFNTKFKEAAVYTTTGNVLFF